MCKEQNSHWKARTKEFWKQMVQRHNGNRNKPGAGHNSKEMWCQACPATRELPDGGSGSQREPNISTQLLTEMVHVEWLDIVRMILPQVHLRKPCYDFSFL
eukprot:TRINITY_DN9411_c0_g1_i1.p3 TRINITY_DN9411_c0_g1~~TRINITY_DN9411_c0_g1_i1.p3  ORF type:complete len:101 (+),score=14.97 TRINITY_DN9411_c0_g1_i1:3744-4046(+)